MWSVFSSAEETRCPPRESTVYLVRRTSLRNDPSANGRVLVTIDTRVPLRVISTHEERPDWCWIGTDNRQGWVTVNDITSAPSADAPGAVNDLYEAHHLARWGRYYAASFSYGLGTSTARLWGGHLLQGLRAFETELLIGHRWKRFSPPGRLVAFEPFFGFRDASFTSGGPDRFSSLFVGARLRRLSVFRVSDYGFGGFFELRSEFPFWNHDSYPLSSAVLAPLSVRAGASITSEWSSHPGNFWALDPYLQLGRLSHVGVIWRWIRAF